MKSTIVLFACLMAFGFSQAQDTEVIYSTKTPREMETLMSSDGGFGGHLSLNVKGTEVYDEMSLLVGGELVFTLNHALNIGVAGYGMPTRIDYIDTEGYFRDALYVEMGYGGFFIEPVFFDQNVVHFTVPILIGGGWSGLTETRFLGSPDQDYSFRVADETVFFVFEPGINMEVNLVRHVKLTLGGSYRYVNGSDLRGVSDTDLGGLTFGAGIRVGWF